MVWRQLSIVVTEASAQQVADLLSVLGAVSVTFQDAADRPLYEPAPGETRLWPETRVIALFPADHALTGIRDFVSDQLEEAALGDWREEPLEEREWSRCWLDHFTPMSFGERLRICPSGQEAEAGSGDVRLILDPGLAFGTGTHATTALCLQWLADHPLDGLRVIDYGCGSGILAIAAVLLGARQAIAIDIDPQAVIATRDNAAKNGVSDKIICGAPHILTGESADLLCANILAQPLIDLAPKIAGHLRKNGMLLLSGILTDQIDAVRTAYASFIRFDPPVEREGWGLLHGINVGS